MHKFYSVKPEDFTNKMIRVDEYGTWMVGQNS